MKTSNKYLRTLLLLALFPLTLWAQDGPVTRANPLPAMPYRLTVDTHGLDGTGITPTVKATPVPVPDPLTDAAYTLDVPASGAYVHSNGQSDANAASVRITLAGTSAAGPIYSPVVTAGTGSAAVLVPVTTGTSENDQPQWTFRMPAAPAVITFVVKGTEDNPYVVDLGNLTPGNGAANGYKYVAGSIIIIQKGASEADRAYYRVKGKAPLLGLGCSNYSEYATLLIESKVQLESLGLMGEDIRIEPSGEGPDSLLLQNEDGAALDISSIKTSISAGVTVKAVAPGAPWIGSDGKVSNPALELQNGSTLIVDGTLYCYGEVRIDGTGQLAGTNGHALQWTFPAALTSDLTVENSDGTEAYLFTAKPESEITTFALFGPADRTYTFRQGQGRLWGTDGSEPTSTFQSPASAAVQPYDMALDLTDLADAPVSFTYTKSPSKGDYSWYYKGEGETNTKARTFCGVVMKNPTATGGTGGTGFTHPATVSLDASAKEITPTLTFIDLNIQPENETDPCLTVSKTGDKAASLTLKAIGGLSLTAKGTTGNSSTTGLKVESGVTCIIGASFGANNSAGRIGIHAAGKAVELAEGATLTGLRSFAFDKPTARNVSMTLPGMEVASALFSSGYRSYATNFPGKCTLSTDEAGTSIYYKDATAPTTSTVEGYLPWFPDFDAARTYAAYDLVPYVLLPANKSNITVSTTENTDLSRIGTDKPATFNSLTVAGVTDKTLTLSMLQVNGGVFIGPDATTVTLNLAGRNSLGQVDVFTGSTLTLTAEEGATLADTKITNLSTFIDSTGLVSSVLLNVGDNAPTLSSSITGTTVIPEGTTTTLSAAAKLTDGAAPAVSYQWQQQANGNWEDLAGKTDAALTVGIGSYRCLVTSVTLLPGSDALVSTTLAPSVTVTQTSEPDPVYYTVTVPAVKGASINPTPAVYTVGAGEDFTLTLKLDPAYDQSKPAVTVDGPDGTRETLTAEVQPDGSFRYTISEVSADLVVSITGIVPNEDPTGNAEVTAPSARAFLRDGQLHIHTPADAEVYVYNFGGTLLYRFRAPAGDSAVQAPDSPCVVVIGKMSFKLGR